MKKVVIGFCMLIMASVPAIAELGIDFSTTYTSRYIWRGYDMGDLTGSVDGSDEIWNNAPGQFFSLDYGLGAGFGLNVWGYFANHANMVEELDYTLSYTYRLGETDLTLGYIHYTFPSVAVYNKSNETVSEGEIGTEGGAAADEAFIGLAFNQLPLAPSLTWYREYTHGWKDDYWSLAMGDSIAGIDYSISTGMWAHYQKFDAVTLGLSKTYEGAFYGFDVTPGLAYIGILDEEINDQKDAHETVFTLDLATSF